MRTKKVILLVDDNDVLLSTRRFLLSNKGYRVISARTSIAALEILESAAPDSIHVLVTDLVMPKMDGNQLARRCKQVRPEIPILITSASVESFDKADCADVFLPKGAGNPHELLERIRVLAARKRGPKPAQLRSYRDSILENATA